MRCVEYMFLQDGDVSWGYFDGPPEEPRTLQLWRENFYRAMYRVLLAGAMLAGAFHEPFILADKEGPPDFLQEFSFMQELSREDEDVEWPLPMTERDVEYLERFPAYSLNAYDKWGTAFGPFAEWLIEKGKTRRLEEEYRSRSSGQDCATERSDRIQLDSIREVLQLLVAYEHLCSRNKNNKFVNGNGKKGFARFSDGQSEVKIRGAVRKASVVLFGVFQVEEISMPALVKDAAHTSVIANPGVQMKEHEGDAIKSPSVVSSPSNIVDIDCILDTLYTNSTRPNHHDGYPAPPPRLQLFTFILRKYFDLRFSEREFELFYKHQPYAEFIQESIIFRTGGYENGIPWSGLLASYSSPVLSFQKLE